GDLRPRPHAPQPAGPAGMTVIDLRSDTVTKPSAAMRRAIAEAVVGDDVLDGDPTTRLLERRVAELLGKEDSLFFPSGTQATATGVPLTRLAAGAGTVMVSFSKGLGCPAGSCLAFRAADRALAWEIRKRLGGGMRQSGILAAAALYALDHHLGRLQQDHAHAKLLAELVADCPAVRPSAPETNIVMIDLVRE